MFIYESAIQFTDTYIHYWYTYIHRIKLCHSVNWKVTERWKVTELLLKGDWIAELCHSSHLSKPVNRLNGTCSFDPVILEKRANDSFPPYRGMMIVSNISQMIFVGCWFTGYFKTQEFYHNYFRNFFLHAELR